MTPTLWTAPLPATPQECLSHRPLRLRSAVDATDWSKAKMLAMMASVRQIKGKASSVLIYLIAGLIMQRSFVNV